MSKIFSGFDADRVRHTALPETAMESRPNSRLANRLDQSTARLLEARKRCMAGRGAEAPPSQASEHPVPAWLLGASAVATRRSAETLRTAFSAAFLHFDKDTDGCLSMEELEALGGELGISGLLESQVRFFMELVSGRKGARKVSQQNLFEWWAEAHDTLLAQLVAPGSPPSAAFRDSAARWQLGNRSTPSEVAAGIAARLGVLCESV